MRSKKHRRRSRANNFGIRKNLLEYDQVMNEQREIIYEERRRVLDGESMRDTIYKYDHRICGEHDRPFCYLQKLIRKNGI